MLLAFVSLSCISSLKLLMLFLMLLISFIWVVVVDSSAIIAAIETKHLTSPKFLVGFITTFLFFEQ